MNPGSLCTRPWLMRELWTRVDQRLINGWSTVDGSSKLNQVNQVDPWSAFPKLPNGRLIAGWSTIFVDTHNEPGAVSLHMTLIFWRLLSKNKEKLDKSVELVSHMSKCCFHIVRTEIISGWIPFSAAFLRKSLFLLKPKVWGLLCWKLDLSSQAHSKRDALVSVLSEALSLGHLKQISRSAMIQCLICIVCHFWPCQDYSRCNQHL